MDPDETTPAAEVEVEVEAASEAVVTEVDGLVLARARSTDDRRWLSELARIVEVYGHEPQRSGPVQDALDSLVIAAAARMKRIIRRDWPAG